MSLQKLRQNRFAIALLDGLSPKEAAAKAGYSETVKAHDLASQPYIKKRLAKLQAAQAVASMVTRDRVVSAHADIAFGKDNTVPERQRSLDSLSRILGYDAPSRMEVGSAGQFKRLSDDELNEKIKELSRTIQIDVKSREVA